MICFSVNLLQVCAYCMLFSHNKSLLYVRVSSSLWQDKLRGIGIEVPTAASDEHVAEEPLVERTPSRGAASASPPAPLTRALGVNEPGLDIDLLSPIDSWWLVLSFVPISRRELNFTRVFLCNFEFISFSVHEISISRLYAVFTI